MSVSDQELVAAPASPYKGLAAFEDSSLDALFFFGREREREIVVANLMAYRLTVLYGTSGVGKSSLLRAGVAHNLRKSAERNRERNGHPELAVCVLGEWSGDPLEALVAQTRAALVELFGEASVAVPSERLVDSLAAWTDGLNCDLYLILDQLDEYFLYQPAGEDDFSEHFAEAATRQGLRVNVVVSMRDDMLSRLDRFKGRIPNLFSNYLRLDHLDREAATAAIVGPVDVYNRLAPRGEKIVLEPELVDAVLDQTVAGRLELSERGAGDVDRGRSARVEAPYLQLVMQRLWEEERQAGSETLRLRTLEALGGADEIVRRHLRNALDALPSVEQDLAAALFNYLVTPSGTKIAHEVADLAQYAAVREDELVPLLAALVDERIIRPVTPVGEPDGSRYEIFHDVLADPVAAWRIAHDAERAVERERLKVRRRHRRLLAVTIVSLVVAAAMVLVTIFALAQWHEARSQRADARAQARKAFAREVAARAALGLSAAPLPSLELAVRAVRLDPKVDVERVLREGILNSPLAVVHVGKRAVNDLDFSRTGLGIAGGADGVAVVFKSLSGRPVRRLRLGAPIEHVLLSRDGTLAVTAGGKEGRTLIWNLPTGALLHELPLRGGLNDVALSPDGVELATAGSGGELGLWSTRSGKSLTHIQVGSAAKRVRFSPDGSLLVVVNAEGQARLYAAHTGAPLGLLESGSFYNPLTQLTQQVPGGRGVTAAAFSPGGELVATASRDHSAWLWRVPGGTFSKLLAGHTGQLSDVEFSPTGTRLVTASADGTAIVWSTAGARISSLAGHSNAVTQASFSPDGTLVLTASTDGTAREWKTDTGHPLLVFAGNGGPVMDAEFSPDGRRIATTGADGLVRLWNPRSEPELRHVGRETGPVTALAVGAGGRELVAGTSSGGASVWRIGRQAPLARIRTGGRALTASFSSQPLVLVSGARTSTLWNVVKKRVVRTFRHDPGATTAALAPDPKVFATARGHHVTLWGNGGPPRTLSFPESVTALAFSTAWRRVVAGGANGSVQVWDIRSGNRLSRLDFGTKPVTSLAFDPTGRYVLTSINDTYVRIWDVQSGRKPRRLPWHFGGVRDAASSADGRWIATAGPRTAGLGKPTFSEPLFRLRGHQARLTRVAWSPTGHRIVTGDEAGDLRTYDCRLCGGVRELLRMANTRLAKTR